MGKMKKLTCLFCLLSSFVFSVPIRQEIQIDQEESLVYYLDPSTSNHEHPIMIVIEGSYDDEVGPQSILRLHRKMIDSLQNFDISVVMMERRGVDGEEIDEDVFHQFNTPSQRLSDHLILINHLSQHPPSNWNGQFIVLGGSEGGPISIKLAHKIHPLACVALVGCGSTSFKDYIWKVIQLTQLSAPWWDRFVSNWWYELPANLVEFEQRCEMMKANPSPQKKWFGQTFLYWADALEQTEYKEFLELKCPAFVVAGSHDVECSSTDTLMEMAKQNHQDVSYLRIEGMGHDVLAPQWGVIDKVLDLMQDKKLLQPKPVMSSDCS